jgi:hypothetical protein
LNLRGYEAGLKYATHHNYKKKKKIEKVQHNIFCVFRDIEIVCTAMN